MRLEPILDPGRAARLRELGLWDDKTLDDHFRAALRDFPGKTAVVDCASGQGAPRVFSYRELDAEADRLGAALARLGIARGEVVSVQLPNGWQVLGLALACARLGAVFNPLMPIYRERELGFMLNLCESALLVVPAQFRGRDHAGMVRGLRPALPHLRHLVVVGDDGPEGFEALRAAAAAAPAPALQPLGPDEVALVMFTSGTSGEPKGVMHTSNTLMATLRTAHDALRMTPDDVALCSAPMGHMLGFALLGIFPWMAKGSTVVMDAWEVGAALRLMSEHGVTYTAGPTPYLADLCNAVAGGVPRPPGLRLFCCAGAPIPPVLVERADRELNMSVCSLWGMTEVQAGTITGIDDARLHAARADGRPPPGMEVKIVDDAGQPLPIGRTGRFVVRGSGVFAGYLKRPELNGFDADGWFDTGDLAYVVDEQGWIRINGRAKDIIKRGGESVPVVEVEALLARHPAVAAVSIVGWPDERLGERVCAFVVTKPGAGFDLQSLRDYLQACRMTPQYWPERIEILDEMPRTASGKVQKFKLRELAARMAQASTAA